MLTAYDSFVSFLLLGFARETSTSIDNYNRMEVSYVKFTCNRERTIASITFF